MNCRVHCKRSAPFFHAKRQRLRPLFYPLPVRSIAHCPDRPTFYDPPLPHLRCLLRQLSRGLCRARTRRLRRPRTGGSGRTHHRPPVPHAWHRPPLATLRRAHRQGGRASRLRHLRMAPLAVPRIRRWQRSVRTGTHAAWAAAFSKSVFGMKSPDTALTTHLRRRAQTAQAAGSERWAFASACILSEAGKKSGQIGL